jgi:hypothetical protein
VKQGMWLSDNGMVMMEIVWDDGPGRNTGGLMYSFDGCLYQELTKDLTIHFSKMFQYFCE